MAASQGAAQNTLHYVLTNSVPVQPGVHKNAVGAGFANSMADVVCITMFNRMLCCAYASHMLICVAHFAA